MVLQRFAMSARPRMLGVEAARNAHEGSITVARRRAPQGRIGPMAKIIDMQAARRRRSVAAAAQDEARRKAADCAAFVERIRADNPALAALVERVPADYFGAGSLF
jgi:hypothetical protein